MSTTQETEKAVMSVMGDTLLSVHEVQRRLRDNGTPEPDSSVVILMLRALTRSGALVAEPGLQGGWRLRRGFGMSTTNA